MGILIQEEYVNATEGYLIGNNEPYESRYDTLGEVYRACVREFGRCISKVYVDGNGAAHPIGWIFQKTAHYEDTKEPFLQEVWVTLHTAPPDRHIAYHYLYLDTAGAKDTPKGSASKEVEADVLATPVCNA